MSDVVISYARSTATQARAVAAALRSLGYDVWLDDELPAHRAYRKVIQEQVTAAKAVLVLWSSDAIDSDWVPSEAERARTARKLVQVAVDDTELPMPFDQIQCADLRGWTGDLDAPGWRKVIASIAELVGEDRSAYAAATALAGAARSNAGATSSRRRILWAALVVVAAIAAAATWYAMTRAPDRSIAARSEATPTDTDAAKTATAFSDRPAIAVLPFENHSDDPKHAVFADGLAEDLITRLSAWRSFPVIGRGSSFHYRGDVDVKQVAKELGVRYVVQGSVRRVADRIRVTAQLIEAGSGKTVWNQTYDRKVADVFDLQDEISTAIAAPLVGDLTRAEASRAQQRGTRNLEAWSLYELGEEHLQRLTSKDNAQARAFYEQAVALEPQFASAHAELGAAYLWELVFVSTSSSERNVALALESARRAVELDPRDWTGHCILAYALLFSHDAANGLASAQRAVDLNPSAPVAWNVLGYAKLSAGDPAGSIAANEQAIRLDPQGSWVATDHETLSEAHWELGQFEAGLEHARTYVTMRPEIYWAYVDMAMNAVGLGRLDDARAAIAEARRVQPDLSLAMIRQNTGFSRPEFNARREAALREAGLE